MRILYLSHFDYNIKLNEDGIRALKASLIIHGNHDDDKDFIIKYAIAAH